MDSVEEQVLPLYMVTVRLPKDLEHDPRNKKKGVCPFKGNYCTDTTGEHHTVLWRGFIADAPRAFEGYHITRIEQAVEMRGKV